MVGPRMGGIRRQYLFELPLRLRVFLEHPADADIEAAVPGVPLARREQLESLLELAFEGEPLGRLEAAAVRAHRVPFAWLWGSMYSLA